MQKSSCLLQQVCTVIAISSFVSPGTNGMGIPIGKKIDMKMLTLTLEENNSIGEHRTQLPFSMSHGWFVYPKGFDIQREAEEDH